MPPALAQPGSTAVFVGPMRPPDARLARALVEHCGLPESHLRRVEPHELEQACLGTTGALFVYFPAGGDAAELGRVLSLSAAEAVIVALDDWTQGPPTVVGKPTATILCGSPGQPLATALTAVLDDCESALTAESAAERVADTGAKSAYSGDGRELVLSSKDTAASKPELHLATDGPVRCLTAFVSANGTAMLATGGDDGRITLWDATTGRAARRFTAHSGTTTALTSTRDGHLVSGGRDRCVRVWEPDTGRAVREVTGYDDVISAVTTFGDAGSRIAATTMSGHLWQSPDDGDRGEALRLPADDVTALATTPTHLVIGTTSGAIELLEEGRFRTVGYQDSAVEALAVSDSDFASSHHTSVVLSTAGGEPVRWAKHTTRVVALAWMHLPDGDRLVVSGSSGGKIRLRNPVTGAQIRVFRPADGVRALTQFTGADGGPRIASVGRSGRVRIWNPGLAATTRTGPVLTKGFGDRTSKVDLLGRGAFIDATAAMLQPRAASDQDDGPSVLTVEGPWGSGKSTMLELVKARLGTDVPGAAGNRLRVWQADQLLRKPIEATTPRSVPLAGSVVATFNPWRHQSSEQVWAGLTKTITHAIEDIVLPDRDGRERYWFTRNAARIDQRHVQRELWKRTRSPFLALGVLGLGLTVVAQLAKLPIPLPWLVAVPSAPLAIGLLHTAKRYLWDRASAFLPRELFAGPVRSTTFANGGNDSIRDPYYNARSGYLYLVQHDVTELLRDLEQRGLQLVVFIDDLDRCTPKTTAEVFEAINVFLSDALPRTRFVLGLDPVVVASHVDHAYRELVDAKIAAHPDDPSPGWTFLRKLVQLPIRLPRTTADNITSVLDSHLGAVHHVETQVNAPAPVPAPTTAVAEVDVVSNTADPDVVTTSRSTVDAVVIAIERHPDVRAYLHRRLVAQPELSVREEKRLINVWQFYLRVLVSTADIHHACHLVTIAELVTRWPAYQHVLRKGLKELAAAVDDDLAWGTSIARLGFKQADATAATNLRALLRDCDAQAVAAQAERLL